MATHRPHPLTRLTRRKTLTVCGLMTGTSLDGIDACLVRIGDRRDEIRWEVVGHHDRPFPRALCDGLLALATDPSPPDAMDLLARCHHALGEALARTVLEALDRHGLQPADLDLVASHGQTVRHRPGARPLGGLPSRSSIQIGSPAVIAERTGAVVVSDFRARDIAAGGQGAPLVPGAESILFAGAPRPLALQNLGGIGNVTYLSALAGRSLAFDTGPANMPLDILARILTHGRRSYDPGGRMAAAGTPREELVTRLLAHPFFRRPPPKSAGREEFGDGFVTHLLDRARVLDVPEGDLLASATLLVARSIARAYRRFLDPLPVAVIVSGGGVRNRTLIRFLRHELPGIPVAPSDDWGVPARSKEALAFAILGYQTARGRASGCPWATGASRSVVQGSITF